MTAESTQQEITVGQRSDPTMCMPEKSPTADPQAPPVAVSGDPASEQLSSSMRYGYLLLPLLALGGAMVLYLSWLGDSKMMLVPWIPRWISGWADQNGTLRTGVPFVFLGAVLAWWLSIRREPVVWRWVVGWLALVALVSVAEIGQIWIPQRTASWIDVGWGAAGAALGMLAGAVAGWLRTCGSRPGAGA